MSGAQPPAIPAFYAGQPATPQLNVMAGALGFLLAKSVFRARRTTTGTVTKNAQTAVPWDAIDEDPYTGWAAGTPTIYTVQAPGWYMCVATASVTGTGAAGTVLIPAFAINGGSQTGQGGSGWEGPEIFIPTGATDPKTATGYWEGYCNTGDQISVSVFMSNEPTTSLTWQTAAGQQSRIEIVWMGV
jgi:hypothetical protein